MSRGIKTFLSVIAIILTTLCKPTAPAQAQFIFNPLQNLGGGVVTAPSCALRPAGQLFVESWVSVVTFFLIKLIILRRLDLQTWAE